MLKKTFRLQCFALSLVLVSSILGTARMTYSATGQLIKNNTPPFVRTAHKIGPADPSDTMEITVWLNVHNRQQLDAVAEDLYDASSPHYRAWLKFSQIAADYAPTACPGHRPASLWHRGRGLRHLGTVLGGSPDKEKVHNRRGADKCERSSAFAAWRPHRP